MKYFKEVLRRNRTAVLVFAMMTVVNTVIFGLYGILAEPLVYAALLSLFLLSAILAADLIREKQRGLERDRALTAIRSEWRSLPEAASLAEADYQKMITSLGTQMERQAAEADLKRQDMLDYSTVWVHEIKTPIAVMRLLLADDTPEHHALSAELQRIERYVDMVLQYIRLGSETNDLVIQEYSLDELIRESVRKFAPQFIEKRLRLDFIPTEAQVVTDAKWFGCILDQLLSNAVKYTPAGSVKIWMSDGYLTVSDTGLGIAAEDQPRIFEKGYTGINGRLGQRSSGLGLYLAKKAADLLSIPLTLESKEGKGSSFILDLRQKVTGAGSFSERSEYV